MTESSSPKHHTPRHHHSGLLLIALYKFAHVALFLAVGVGAIKLLHKDLDDVVVNLALRLRFDPESRLVDFLLEKASLINDPMLKRIGAGAFAYAGLMTAEGIGLYLEKAWGEILTLVVTGSFLPFEFIELIRRQTWIRASLFGINLAVFLYLISVILEGRRKRAALRGESAQD
jgi:uncharacterized membrane protein (DUF2068 family)